MRTVVYLSLDPKSSMDVIGYDLALTIIFSTISLDFFPGSTSYWLLHLWVLYSLLGRKVSTTVRRRVFPYNPQHDGNGSPSLCSCLSQKCYFCQATLQHCGFFLFKHCSSHPSTFILAVSLSWAYWFPIQWRLLSSLLLTDCACVVILNTLPYTSHSLVASRLSKN